MFILIIAIFFISLLLGMPIAFVLGLTGVSHIATMTTDYFAVIPQRMFAGINITSLTAIPFFIVAGELMNGGGVTKKLLNFVKEVVGTIRGGLAYSTIFTAALLSSILGSSNAVASILCNIMIPDMEKTGYKREFSGALIASSGVLGPVIPPSTTFIYYSVLTGASVKMLFMAGIVPGVLMAFSFCFVVWRYVRKNNMPPIFDKVNGLRLLKSFLVALPTLIVPIVIVGGVITGIFTPTESGAVACVVALILGLAYRTLPVRAIPRMLLRAAKSSSAIMFIIACGNIMGWAMAIDNVPELIQNAILGLSSNYYVIIIVMIIILTLIGMLMEATAAMLIFSTTFLMIATQIGMDPLHFGLVFCLMLIIALVTPPVGMTLFVTANLAEVPVSKISKAIVPFIAAALLIIIFMAYMPGLSLLLPRVLLGYGK